MKQLVPKVDSLRGRKLLDRMWRRLPVMQSAEETAAALLAALPGEDRGGAQALALRLQAHPAALGPAIDELLASPATLQRHVPPMLGRWLGADPQSDLFVSLGTHCFTASLLRRWGLRSAAGPFDWLFSSAAMVTHCIEDDFRAFLDREQYAPVPPELRRDGAEVNRTNHRLYQQMFGIEFIFNHHDPHEEATHAHFTRSVDRFRAVLGDARRKFFILHRTQCEGPLDDLHALHHALAQRCKSFCLFVFETPPALPTPMTSPTLRPVIDTPTFKVSEFRPCSAWGPLQFEDLLDEHTLMRYVLMGQSRTAPSAPP